MLSSYDAQVTAFYIRDSGEFLCADCAKRATTTVTVEKAERGLDNAYGLRGIIRYEVGNQNGERTWEAAEERVRDFAHDHPAVWRRLTENDRHAEQRLVDRVAEKLGDLYSERCGQCDAVLD